MFHSPWCTLISIFLWGTVSIRVQCDSFTFSLQLIISFFVFYRPQIFCLDLLSDIENNGFSGLLHNHFSMPLFLSLSNLLWISVWRFSRSQVRCRLVCLRQWSGTLASLQRGVHQLCEFLHCPTSIQCTTHVTSVRQTAAASCSERDSSSKYSDLSLINPTPKNHWFDHNGATFFKNIVYASCLWFEFIASNDAF